MPSNTLSDAIVEAYATAPSNLIYLDTLEISNPAVDSLFLISDRVDQTLILETGVSQLFSSCGFRFLLPASGANGIQSLSLSIDNIDQRPSDFVKAVVGSLQPVQITYRPYLNTDLTRPQMNPPLVLFLTDIIVTAADVSGSATFADVLNRQYLSQLYNTRRFPAL